MKNIPQLFNLANKAFQGKDFSFAENLYKEIVRQDSDNAQAHHMLAILYAQKKDNDKSEFHFEKSIQADARNVSVLLNFAQFLNTNKNFDRALGILEGVVEKETKNAEVFFKMGVAWKGKGEIDKAIEAYTNCIDLLPSHLQATYNLANTYYTSGKLSSAIPLYEKAIELNPKFPQAHNNLGLTFKKLNDFAASEYHFLKALELDPVFAEALKNLGDLYFRHNEFEKGKKVYEKLRTVKGKKLLEYISLVQSPLILQSKAQVKEHFQQTDKKIKELLNETAETISFNDILENGFFPSPHWIYFGSNEKGLKEAMAEFFRKYITPLKIQIENSSTPHIAFLVTSGHEEVFVKCMKGLINNLSGNEYKISLVCVAPEGRKVIEPHITNENVVLVEIPQNINEAVRLLGELQIDLLYYWEIGTDVINYMLPFFKPAAMQATSWGWPVTSGMNEVDYFISSESLEEDGKKHFTEFVLKMKNIPVYYYKPDLSFNPVTKLELGLPENKRIYTCLQNLFKIHPDYDSILKEITIRDPDAVIVFIKDFSEKVSNDLRARIGLSQDKVLFMDRMQHVEYFSLIIHSDVILDSIYYNGGANTTYDAFACGKSIVTMPWNQTRGRYAKAAYDKMGFDDCIAKDPEEYINTAVKLGTDLQFRNSVEEKIKSNADLLFEDIEAVREFEELVLKLMAEKRN